MKKYFVLAVVLATLITGCGGQQTATQQIAEQTDDPGTIALAVYADAQDAYIETLELYRPYQQILIESNPELDTEIVGYFHEANKILNDWERLGNVPVDDKHAFRDYLRQVSIRLAKDLEEK